VLDAGCGEGKNAVYLAKQGAVVHAIDCSELAIKNARTAWPETANVTWEVADVRRTSLRANYDIVIAYGLLHCLPNVDEVRRTVTILQRLTKPNGFNVLCAFNDREHDLTAHPAFSPTLLRHDEYESMYSGWDIVNCSDTDLHETHPHNNIPHRHSLTRLLAMKR
jgi:2-polyprenyl-3-methyl-5-hydroxy-6-metoxy-1,4-benzoquinol methylase